MEELQFQQLQSDGYFKGDRCQSEITLPERSSLFYMCFLSTLCRGSQFLEFERPQGWLQLWVVIPFFSVFSCYEQHVVFLWRQSILQSYPLCMFWVSVCRWCITFNGINTKSFTFLVSLWFLSPSFVICNVLCLRTKVLNSVVISWGCMSWWTCCWTKESK